MSGSRLPIEIEPLIPPEPIEPQQIPFIEEKDSQIFNEKRVWSWEDITDSETGDIILNLRNVVIPNNVTHIELEGNYANFQPIYSLPDNIPNSVVSINCSKNRITDLPRLPPNLRHLNVSDNGIDTLPDLPDSLTYLDCFINRIYNLPQQLPPKLEHLNCSYNLLSSLPRTPKTLKYLNCSNNNLKPRDLGLKDDIFFKIIVNDMDIIKTSVEKDEEEEVKQEKMRKTEINIKKRRGGKRQERVIRSLKNMKETERENMREREEREMKENEYRYCEEPIFGETIDKTKFDTIKFIKIYKDSQTKKNHIYTQCFVYGDYLERLVSNDNIFLFRKKFKEDAIIEPLNKMFPIIRLLDGTYVLGNYFTLSRFKTYLLYDPIHIPLGSALGRSAMHGDVIHKVWKVKPIRDDFDYKTIRNDTSEFIKEILESTVDILDKPIRTEDMILSTYIPTTKVITEENGILEKYTGKDGFKRALINDHFIEYYPYIFTSLDSTLNFGLIDHKNNFVELLNFGIVYDSIKKNNLSELQFYTNGNIGVITSEMSMIKEDIKIISQNTEDFIEYYNKKDILQSIMGVFYTDYYIQLNFYKKDVLEFKDQKIDFSIKFIYNTRERAKSDEPINIKGVLYGNQCLFDKKVLDELKINLDLVENDSRIELVSREIPPQPRPDEAGFRSDDIPPLENPRLSLQNPPPLQRSNAGVFPFIEENVPTEPSTPVLRRESNVRRNLFPNFENVDSDGENSDNLPPIRRNLIADFENVDSDVSTPVLRRELDSDGENSDNLPPIRRNLISDFENVDSDDGYESMNSEEEYEWFTSNRIE